MVTTTKVYLLYKSRYIIHCVDYLTEEKSFLQAYEY
jgi:hypothetical protein